MAFVLFYVDGEALAVMEGLPDRDAYCLFAIVIYVLATVFVLVNLCFGCAACGDCDAFLISERQIASISDAITALSRSHHQQWGRDDSRRKESIKLRSRR